MRTLSPTSLTETPVPTEPYDPYYEEYQQYLSTQDPAPFDGFAAASTFLAGGLIIYLVLTAGAIALGLWVWYTVTWRAVRRGLYEYHNHGYTPKGRKTTYPPQGWR